MTHNVARSLAVRSLTQTIESGAIYPAFQPVVDLSSGRISSFEVLARYTDEILGEIAPLVFIPLIEQRGLLNKMMDYLVRRACNSAASWPGGFRLSFNVSPSQFKHPKFSSKVVSAVQATGFPIDRVQIELTEHAIIPDDEIAKETVVGLKELGIQFLLDDFGTGFSSLTRLQSLPFDKIKIDAGFVRTMDRKRDSRKIVSAVIGLGHSLGLPVIAEGVETPQQMALLRRLGCDYGQGYLFGRPCPAEGVPSILNERGQQPYDPAPFDLSCNRRLAELECLYANAPIAICFVDRSVRLMSANGRYGEVFGVDPASAIGKSLFDLFPDQASAIRDDVDALLRGDCLQARAMTLRNGAKEGLASAAAVKDEDGEIVGISFAVVERPLGGGEVGRSPRLTVFQGGQPASLRAKAG